MRKGTAVRILFLCPVLVIMLVIITAAMAGERTHLKLNRESRISGRLILLGEIARIDGGDPLMVERMASIVIGRAPLPGQSRLIDEQQVRLKLKQSGIPLNRIAFHSPPRVEVIRDYVEINGETIERAVREFILKKMPWSREQVNIVADRRHEPVILPGGKITYQIIPRAHEDYLGPTHISVLFKVDGDPQRRIWLNPEVQVFTPVVLSARPMPRHHVVNRSDLRVERLNLARLPSNVMTDPAEVIGKRMRTALAANRPLRADMLELPPLVKKGDIVAVVLESDSIKVTTLGMVREKGVRGDTVRVMNIASRKEIYGRVIDARTVKVSYPLSN